MKKATILFVMSVVCAALWNLVMPRLAGAGALHDQPPELVSPDEMVTTILNLAKELNIKDPEEMHRIALFVVAKYLMAKKEYGTELRKLNEMIAHVKENGGKDSFTNFLELKLMRLKLIFGGPLLQAQMLPIISQNWDELIKKQNVDNGDSEKIPSPHIGSTINDAAIAEMRGFQEHENPVDTSGAVEQSGGGGGACNSGGGGGGAQSQAPAGDNKSCSGNCPRT